ATTSAWRRGKSPSGLAVSSTTCAPAPRATPQMASTVENAPGPAEARRRSPGEAGGAVTSPTQCAGRPRCARRMQRARIMRPSRPTPCTNTRPPRAAAAASSATRTGRAAGSPEKTAAIWAQMAAASPPPLIVDFCYLIPKLMTSLRLSGSVVQLMVSKIV
ncbi:Os04g0568500, partial [Oryza sativa Japonica Group]